MIVVSDTSPITYLIQIDSLHLLSLLYQKIIIPQEVYNELLKKHDTVNDVLQLGIEKGWVEISDIVNRKLYESLLLEIDPGESAAITLAIEKNADLLLIDERKGNQKAAEFNIKSKGVLGILAEAKKQHLIPSFTKVLMQLTEQTNFRISKNLLTQLINTFND